MRTRRSPRNQERLWRALGGPPKPRPPEPRILTDAEIDALPGLSRPARAAMKREMAGRRMRAAMTRPKAPEPAP